ncbi:hypothetical protein [Haloimpatiens massiliensis]|uniref:hypothetical protein n=1 Tax=Haloimpatiens massiliensis TaxID=1658110 RepID=UPI000C83E0FE|nr:hypothetical protein [Haloimpatiens massiliensis]
MSHKHHDCCNCCCDPCRCNSCQCDPCRCRSSCNYSPYSGFPFLGLGGGRCFNNCGRSSGLCWILLLLALCGRR